MPFSAPTLTQLRQQVLQDINAAQITDQNGNVLMALLQRAVLRVLANATAGMSYEHFGYLDWIAKQAVPWTATDEFLDGWANLKGIYREAATASTGTVSFPGTNNSPIPNGTYIVRSDNVVFITTAAGTIASGVNTVSIQAVVAGSVSSFDAGTSFALANPIAGVAYQSSGSTQSSPGTDVETDDDLRTRMLQAYAAPPQGGDRQDYIQWALAVPGVTRVWIAPNGMGVGTVVVYVMLDEAEAQFGGFPQGTNGSATYEPRAATAAGDQLEVANYIFGPNRQPVTALVYVLAPIEQAQPFAITGLGANNTGTMQTAIKAALADMLLQYGNVGGTVNPATGGPWPAIQPSAWYDALVAIPGLSTFTVASPTGPITPNQASLLTLGTVTFAS